MDDTTDTLTRPAGFPPPAVAPSDSNAPWPGQISQAGPSLPAATAHVPRATAVEPLTLEHLGAHESTQRPTKRNAKRGGFRRGVSWLVVLGAIAGLGFAGLTYGPDLIDRVTDRDESNGPSAALEYPVPTAAPIAVRTATFEVSQPDQFGGTQSYQMTADFEAGVAKVIVPRASTPNLEILTLWDQAFIRRVDEPTWYSLARGDLPIDFALGSARWVRTLDEMVSPTIRPFATIDDATESSVGATPARRLVVSADAQQLLQAQSMAGIAEVDGAPPAPAPMPAGITVLPTPEGVDRLSMELWVDDSGLVRKSVLPTELGGETIIVTSATADAWEPLFPLPDEVLPLTAQALLHLGL